MWKVIHNIFNPILNGKNSAFFKQAFLCVYCFGNSLLVSNKLNRFALAGCTSMYSLSENVLCVPFGLTVIYLNLFFYTFKVKMDFVIIFSLSFIYEGTLTGEGNNFVSKPTLS